MNTAAIKHYPNYFDKEYSSVELFLKAKSGRLGLICAALYFFIIVISIAYFLEMADFSSLGYEMKDYQKNIDTLKTDNKRMAVSAAEYSSFKNIEASFQTEKLNLVKASKYQYFVMPNSSFARR